MKSSYCMGLNQRLQEKEANYDKIFKKKKIRPKF